MVVEETLEVVGKVATKVEPVSAAITVEASTSEVGVEIVAPIDDDEVEVASSTVRSKEKLPRSACQPKSLLDPIA